MPHVIPGIGRRGGGRREKKEGTSPRVPRGSTDGMCGPKGGRPPQLRQAVSMGGRNTNIGRGAHISEGEGTRGDEEGRRKERSAPARERRPFHQPA